MNGLQEMALLLAAVLTGLLLLYVVIRLAVRDGVLDARAKDDAQLAQRRLVDPIERLDDSTR